MTVRPESFNFSYSSKITNDSASYTVKLSYFSIFY